MKKMAARPIASDHKCAVRRSTEWPIACQPPSPIQTREHSEHKLDFRVGHIWVGLYGLFADAPHGRVRLTLNLSQPIPPRCWFSGPLGPSWEVISNSPLPLGNVSSSFMASRNWSPVLDWRRS